MMLFDSLSADYYERLQQLGIAFSTTGKMRPYIYTFLRRGKCIIDIRIKPVDISMGNGCRYQHYYWT